MSSEGALCPVHGEVATATCPRCGAFKCGECPAGSLCAMCRERFGLGPGSSRGGAHGSPRERVAPGIAVAIVGGLSFLFTLGMLVAVLLSPEDPVLAELDTSRSGAYQAGYVVGNWAVRVLCVLTSLVSLVGGIQMARGRNYGLAFAGALLAVIPLCNFCCGVSTGVGIWALVVLNRPGVRAGFGVEG